MLYYSISLVIESDAIINNIIIDGTSDYTLTGIGSTDALINLNWDGQVIPSPEYLADSMVAIAAATTNKYDCWIAMDYVITLENGPYKDSLRNVLCDIPNITYEDGFCNCSIDLQPADTTIKENACIYLYGAVGDNYTYEWYADGVLVSTDQDYYDCPLDSTTYLQIATNPLGCPAEDSIVVNVKFLSFDLGPDTSVCENNSCVELIGPPDMLHYWWYVADTIYDTVQIIEPCPLDTTLYILEVEDTLGATASDSIYINILPLPIFEFDPDTITINKGDSTELSGPDGDFSYQWFEEGEFIDTLQIITVYPDSTTLYSLILTNSDSCSYEDSILVIVNQLSFDLGPDTSICRYLCYEISGPPDMAIYEWYVSDTIFDTVQTIVPCPMDTTMYTLWVQDSTGATASDSVTIEVKISPEVSFQWDTIWACTGDTIDIEVNASEDIVSYYWIYNDLDSITQINTITFEDVQDSAYAYVGVTAENDCQNSDSTYIPVTPFPEITLVSDTTICAGDSVFIFASGAESYFWETVTGTVATDSSFWAIPTDTTTYTVFASYINSVCYTIDSITVSVVPAAQTQIVYDTNRYCKFDSVKLSASGANNYLWMPSGDTTAFYNFVITDTVMIGLFGETEYGCAASDSVEFYSLAVPEVTITPLLPAYCYTDPPVTLVGEPEDGTFGGSGVVGGRFIPEAAGSGEHFAYYRILNEESGCYGYDTTFTTVYGGDFEIDLGNDTTLLFDEIYILDAGPGFDNYFWNTGATSQKITIRGSDRVPGTYEYSVMGIINGCSSPGNVFITFEGPDAIAEHGKQTMHIYPNPNDGSFKVYLENINDGVSLKVYDISGVVIYNEVLYDCMDNCILDIDIEPVNPGLYFIQAVTASRVFSSKVILK